MRLAVIAFLALVALGSSASAQPVPDAAVKHAGPKQPDNSIAMHRTMCLGDCPLYTVAVDSTGKVFYLGEDAVTVTGVKEAVMKPEDLKTLWRDIDALKPFKLRDHYDHGPGLLCATDYPGADLFIKRNGKFKHIADDHGCDPMKPMPELDALRHLEDELDRLSGVGPWAKVPPQPPRVDKENP
jgi:hypothetical protein